MKTLFKKLYHYSQFAFFNVLNLIPLLKLRKYTIAVYTMGKVGSTTLFQTIKKNFYLKRAIYKIHFLSQKELKILSLKNDYWPRVFYQSAMKIHNDINSGKPIFIISTIREPIEREISYFFQTYDSKFPNKTLDQFTNEEIISIIKDNGFNNDLQWVDSELKEITGFDINASLHLVNDGVLFVEKDQYKILILPLEHFNTTLKKTLKRFLGINIGKLRHTNIGKQKHYKHRLAEIKENFHLDSNTLDEIYNREIMKTFYTEVELLAFKKRWLAMK